MGLAGFLPKIMTKPFTNILIKGYRYHKIENSIFPTFIPEKSK